MKVVNAFFCRLEKKSYKVGDTYTGTRKDLFPVYLEKVKKENKKGPKVKLEKKG